MRRVVEEEGGAAKKREQSAAAMTTRYWMSTRGRETEMSSSFVIYGAAKGLGIDSASFSSGWRDAGEIFNDISFIFFFFRRIMKIERVSDNCPDYLGSRADISINSLTDLSRGAYKQATDLINPATRPRYLLCRAVRPPQFSINQRHYKSNFLSPNFLLERGQPSPYIEGKTIMSRGNLIFRKKENWIKKGRAEITNSNDARPIIHSPLPIN